MAIQVCKERCLLINFKEREDGSVFIVFMLPEFGLFLKGEIKADLAQRLGEINRFYWANIQFVDDADEDAVLEIINLEMDKPAESSPPIF